MAAVVDTLRLTAEEANGLLERARDLRRGASRRVSGGDRRARRRAPLLPEHGRPTRRRGGSDRAQGRHLDEGRRDDGRLQDPLRLRARVRRDRGWALQGRGSTAARKDEPRRVRDGLLDGELGVRPDAEPLGSGAGSRRLRRRIGRGSERGAGAVGARLGHGWIDQAALGAVRERRPAPDLRDRLSIRRGRLRVEPGSGRAGGQDRARRRAPVLDHRRSRSARLDDRGAARAGAASRGRLTRGSPHRGADRAERGRGHRAGSFGLRSRGRSHAPRSSAPRWAPARCPVRSATECRATT